VNVRVAVLATLSDIAEHWLNVALGAGHRRVHAAQRVLRLIVIEFGNRSDRFPRTCRVAVLARDVQIAVRAMRATGCLRRCAPRCPREREQQNEIKYARRCQHNSPLRLASATDLFIDPRQRLIKKFMMGDAIYSN